MKILVTGGTGYIGSHAVVELVSRGNEVTIVDDLSNSDISVLESIKTLTNKEVAFHQFDLQETQKLSKLFDVTPFDAVIHFAGLKAVGESVKNPLIYYQTNVASTLSLLKVMQSHGVDKLIFSSSATVYGSAPSPYKESMQTGVGITNPYGQTKYMIEQILKDMCSSNPAFKVGCLRYFNPVGSHSSGLLEENPSGTPNNLMPYIVKVAHKELDILPIFGDDYNTTDGTAERDYIHVVDLAKGHAKTLEFLQNGFEALNLGSGKPTSVMELVKTFSNVNSVKVDYVIKPRRAGDLDKFYADASLALEKINWKTTLSVEDMCRDSWHL